VPTSLRISILLMTASSVSAIAQSTTDAAATPVPATAIVQRMVEQNAIRAQHLKYFTSQRHYHIDFHGLGRSVQQTCACKRPMLQDPAKAFTSLINPDLVFLSTMF